MLDQLLWIDVLLKLTAGGLLLVAPRLSSVTIGFGKVEPAIFARLLGITFLAVALAIFADAAGWIRDGLGAGGCALINIVAGITLLTFLLVPHGVAPRRARGTLWLFGSVLIALGIGQLFSR